MPANIATLTLNPAVDLSASVDRIEPEIKMRCADPQRDPGGGGINVARVMRRDGREVRAIFPAGGTTGKLLQTLVERENIDALVIEHEGETRESFTVFERQSGREFRFVLPGPELEERTWGALLGAMTGLGTMSFIVASGSLPPGAPKDCYAQVARVARDLGARLAVDTSGPALKAVIEEKPFLIKPNLQELRELTGSPLAGEEDWRNAARELVEQGRVGMVALTLGEHGALLATREGVWRAQAPKVKLVSTVGAGDSFLAMLVCGLSAGMAVEDALRQGVAAGTAALLSPGTDLCRPADIERLLPEISVKRI